MMANTDNSSLRVSGRRRRLGIYFLVILILLVVVGVVVFRNVGRWLVREDALGKADVIVVLSGGLPFRAEGAASVYKSGYAPAVWVSRPEGPQEELAEIARDMRRDGKHTVIIVTSPQHTRRVRALWRKLVGDEPRAIVRSAPDDPFDADHWWRTTADVLAVVRESMGLLNVWAGLPVKPHLQ